MVERWRRARSSASCARPRMTSVSRATMRPMVAGVSTPRVPCRTDPIPMGLRPPSGGRFFCTDGACQNRRMDAPGYLDTIRQRSLQRLRGRSTAMDALLAEHAIAGQVARLAVVSDFAIGTLVQQPELLSVLVNGGDLAPPELTPGNRTEWPSLLRRYRAAASTRLAWRDVLGHD